MVSRSFLFIKELKNEESFAASPLRRFAASPLLIAGGLLMIVPLAIVPEAYAGEWELISSALGKVQLHEDGAPPSGDPYDYTVPWMSYRPFGYGYDHIAFNKVAGYADNSGEIKFTCNWVRNKIPDENGTEVDDPNDNPPKFLVVEFLAKANASVSSNYGSPATDDRSKQFAKVRIHNEELSGNTNLQWANRKNYVVIETNNQDTVTIPPLVLSARAELEGGREGSGFVGAQVGGNATITSRFVFISSDIEASYKKYVGVLPSVYQVKVNGVMLPDPDKATLVYDDADDAKDVWKLLCLPGQNGTPEVHSAAAWVSNPNGTNSLWLGGAKFTANAPGFDFGSSYEWTEPADSHRQPTSGNRDPVIDFTATPPSFNDPFYGIRLGNQADGSDLIKSSAISATVTDSTVSLSNSYTINWHLPQEWEKQPYDTATLPPVIFSTPGYIVDSNGTQLQEFEPNRTINFEIEAPVTTFKYNAKNGLNTAGVVLGVVGAGVGILVTTGALSVGPAGWIALAIAAAGGGASLVSGNMPAPTLDTKSSDYAQYKADMRFQKMINDARANDPNAYLNERSRCDDSLTVDAAVAEINRVESAQQSWDKDIFFGQQSSSTRCRAIAGRYQSQDTYRGDKYDKNGYAGPCLLDVVRPRNVFYVFNWTVSPNSPPAPNPPTTGNP